MTCSSGERTIFFSNISLAVEIILSSIALAISEYHGIPLNHVVVGQELVVGEDCGLQVRQVELGLDVEQLVEDVDVGSDGLHPVEDVGLELL